VHYAVQMTHLPLSKALEVLRHHFALRPTELVDQQVLEKTHKSLERHHRFKTLLFMLTPHPNPMI
jgi:hypothetical protein